MNKDVFSNSSEEISKPEPGGIYHKFYKPHAHISSTFGSGWFGEKAEAFARFFGTPVFLGAQTILVIFWITMNFLGVVRFDPYPFILLNLAFSVQAAYSAPLILLAQTRQADRDKIHAEVDAQHREALAQSNTERLNLAQQSSEQMLALLEQNTQLTTLTKQLSERIEKLTAEMHRHLLDNHK